MTESSAISFLVFGDSDTLYLAVFGKGFLKSRLFSGEIQIAYEKSGRIARLGLLVLTFFSALGLFNVQPPSHVFSLVVL